MSEQKPWRPHPAVVVHIARLLEIDHMKALAKRRREEHATKKEGIPGVNEAEGKVAE